MTNDQPTAQNPPLLPRGGFRLVIDRQFGALFWGKLLGGAGTWIHSIVAAIVVFATTESALWVGLVTVAQFTPQLVLGPLSGKWADRGNVSLQLIVGRALCAVGSSSIAVYCFVSGDPEGARGASVVLLGSFIAGLGYVVGGPAQQSIVPLLIRPGELSKAMSLNSLPLPLSRIVGPAVGAVVAVQFGPGHGFLLAGLTNVIFIILLLCAALPEGVSPVEGTDFSVRAGLRHVWQDRTLLLLLLVVAATGVASEPAISLAPTFAAELNAGNVMVGQVTGCFGIGAMLGYAVLSVGLRAHSQQRLAQVGLVLMAVSSSALAFTGSVASTLVLFGVLGVGFMVSNTTASTLILQRVPPALRGRVMALWFVAFVGARPVAAATGGVLADAFSRATPMLFSAALLVLLLAFFRVSKLDFSTRPKDLR